MRKTCDNCIHNGHAHNDGFTVYYYCDLSGEYIEKSFALNEDLECDGFVSHLDDNETKKSEA